MAKKKSELSVNNCIQFESMLNMCTQVGQLCGFMSDPTTCPDYKDEIQVIIHNYSHDTVRVEKIQVKPINKPVDDDTVNTETTSEFVDRVEGELDAMGIKVVREPDEVIPEKQLEMPDDF